MEKTQKSGEGVKTSAKLAEEAQDKHKRIERLESEYEIILFITKKKLLNYIFLLFWVILSHIIFSEI